MVTNRTPNNFIVKSSKAININILNLLKSTFSVRKTSHKWFTSRIPVVVELGNAQFCVVLLNKRSNRHLSLGSV